MDVSILFEKKRYSKCIGSLIFFSIKIFIDDLAEVETFPRDEVLQHLESISSDLAIQYLEYIIEELHDESPEFHNRLVIAYLEKINSDKKRGGKIMLVCWL